MIGLLAQYRKPRIFQTVKVGTKVIAFNFGTAGNVTSKGQETKEEPAKSVTILAATQAEAKLLYDRGVKTLVEGTAEELEQIGAYVYPQTRSTAPAKSRGGANK